MRSGAANSPLKKNLDSLVFGYAKAVGSDTLTQPPVRARALCSYYFLVPLSVLPPTVYPALAARVAQRMAWPAPPRLPPLWLVLARASRLQLAGAAVFLLGNALQCHSHWLLAALGTRGARRGKQAYKIPRGGCRRAGCLPKQRRWALAGAGTTRKRGM